MASIRIEITFNNGDKNNIDKPLFLEGDKVYVYNENIDEMKKFKD